MSANTPAHSACEVWKGPKGSEPYTLSATTFVSWLTAESDPDLWPRYEPRRPELAPQATPKGAISGLDTSSNRKPAPQLSLADLSQPLSSRDPSLPSTRY